MFSKKMKARTLFATVGLALIGAAGGCAAQTDAPPVTQMAVADFNSCAKPMYPQDDVKAGHQGTVTLGFLVAADGAVGDSKIVKSSGFAAMDEAARAAIAKCHFSPALAGGKPVAHWTRIQYVWTLK